MKSANADLQNRREARWNRALAIIIQASALQCPVSVKGNSMAETVDLNTTLRIGFSYASARPSSEVTHGVPRMIMTIQHHLEGINPCQVSTTP